MDTTDREMDRHTDGKKDRKRDTTDGQSEGWMDRETQMDRQTQ